jgi:hypothetical protein
MSGLKRLLWIQLTVASVTSLAPISSHRRPTRIGGWMNAFPSHRYRIGQCQILRPTLCKVKSSEASEEMDDETLLNTVSLEQLVRLCDQCSIPQDGSKLELLLRLRNHSDAEAERARQRNLARRERVEQGGSTTDDNSRERYEIVGDHHDGFNAGTLDDENGYFFFDLPAVSDDLKQKQERDRAEAKGKESSRRAFTGTDQVTAPPPPVEANADGERVVTVYSTTELNDLTSVAAAQPGRGMSLDALESGVGSNQPRPWDTMARTSGTTTQQFQQAKEKITELVTTLLSMSGAPAFSSMVDGERIPYVGAGTGLDGFVGFNPTMVPVEMLTASSQALRAGRGEVLQEVLRQFELQAIGQDGMAGDNKRNGGGHYREVMKVRAFLEGYRHAEVRRLARETTALLLDKLVLEGVDGLDLALRSMLRSDDDMEDHAGTLNDSLIDFLSDAIRQKEKEMENSFANRAKLEQSVVMEDDDVVEKYWNVSIVDGQRVETLDPNNNEIKSALQAEVVKSSEAMMIECNRLPETAPEQLLLLLKLLRDRIKTEAAFSSAEKGQNLRLLAYCLRTPSRDDREQLLIKYLGSSLDVSDRVYRDICCLEF